MSLGLRELLIILVIVLVLFGGRRLPELAKSLGKAIRIFRNEAERLSKQTDDTHHNDNKQENDHRLT